ncbi:MAG: hypothetical protein ACI4BG_04395, partial [Prevotella sp.]
MMNQTATCQEGMTEPFHNRLTHTSLLSSEGWFYKLGRVVLGLRPPFLAMAELKQAWLCSF